VLRAKVFGCYKSDCFAELEELLEQHAVTRTAVDMKTVVGGSWFTREEVEKHLAFLRWRATLSAVGEQQS
jgi:hypothetical protein